MDMPNEVDVAFEILLEEIETCVNALEAQNAEAWDRRNLLEAKQLLNRACTLIEFRRKVDELRRHWEILETQSSPSLPPAIAPNLKLANRTGQSAGRLPRGARTSEDAYYEPILLALVDLGGSAPVSAVLENVGERMKGVLKDVDYEHLRSDSREPRWRNTAKWARQTLIDRHLLKSSRQYGTWEISEPGKRWVSERSGSVSRNRSTLLVSEPAGATTH